MNKQGSYQIITLWCNLSSPRLLGNSQIYISEFKVGHAVLTDSIRRDNYFCVCVCVTALMWLSFTVNDQASEPKTQMTNVMYWLAYKRP